MDKKGNYICVCLYVDDMIIAAKTSKEIQEVKMAPTYSFMMKALGEAKYILGMEIDHALTNRADSLLRRRGEPV
ncbi:hypothetical protein PC129_g17083 [Phytophthora cactorum]|uniref:Reverse transcriptase Ty1/copia-type domain-containing protein n=1 Tax=Phytophthora cactorum TaxID=29920 RepID=A0A329R6H7_9STRA|nr:hypothetical protein Pcac1_g13752 [Phytophthora cactorum]KAG2795174.1 hypothetical protein PC111_g22261 [Phytophthora cactorum]KAG2795678.1 hypothetical protein PC112_g22528 [Phytophthora cactorum]KAG2844240.1 hypothetical protein PC113_g18433 [Phytophthora cactorum]KAG2883077.1 hypothetical protein PC115_g21737 [Phytophthora cactorum]